MSPSYIARVQHVPCPFLLKLSSYRLQEVNQLQNVILLTEEVLLETLCFDFVTPNPHAELIDLFDAYQEDSRVQDYAWSIAHDS
jgi:hypothetical protein